MDTYIDGDLITPEERKRLYLENLADPVPGIDYLWHKYSMSTEELERIHGKREVVLL